MKCTNKIKYGFSICLILCFFSVCGCGKPVYELPYDVNSPVSGFKVTAGGKSNSVAEPFASDLCLITEDITLDSVDMSQVGAAVLFDTDNKEVLYSYNAHEKLYPASLTKIMTAHVALQNSSPDKILTATNAVNITESGAQLCGLKAGDTMTMSQALHILLLYSANDVAMLIAENVGGTVEGFLDMMNEEAKRLGATNTHFVNPHGLTDVEHYTTAYDMYLIFNEAIKNDTFKQMIQTTSYQTTYYDKDGKAKELSFSTTNRFLKGHFDPPSNVTVIGGKTGTTNAAGHCLMLLSKDASGAPYISIILRSQTSDELYAGMIDLLDEINK